ncbi:ankyrin repeat and LEM domain-containing protein 1 [Gadus chalcogrammus]|uniref:ankyrin repeat and LEM domain-containing protein 1 n=1 Tax=Gadus chalcogrammus TaxID=1042646 RepID=UPI0024C4BAD9|nr:ankyrin repeat and LEM domain-containing protein 1 [Gadus chalcogrammus]
MDQNKKRLGSQLCKAVKDEDPRSVQALLSRGARADVVGARGVAAVHLAVGKETEKSIRCLKLLLQHGADPNARSSEGLTPLHVAALWGCYQNVKLLLANGGNPNVTDQDGNTPGQFAEQQDNRKCAQLLQSHQTQSADGQEDLTCFQYSLYSDQTDVSSYPDSETSLSSRSSMISDFGDDPLSSTRHSALFDHRAPSQPTPWWRRGPSNGQGDANPTGAGGPGRDWNQNKEWACGDGPSFLSSTRVSTVGCASAGPVPQEDVSLGDVTWAPNPLEGPSLLSSTRMSTAGPDPPYHNVEAPFQRGSSHPLGLEGRLSAINIDAPTIAVAGPPRRASRKSVSFRAAAEYFPVFRPDSAEPAFDTAPFDSSQDADFLSSEHLVTVLQRQGIDVTSPDHVHVFDWDCGDDTEGDMEKTVMSNFRLAGGEETDDEEEEEDSSSGSHYSSCDSDHYTTAHYTTAHGGLVPSSRSASSEEEAREGAPTPEDQPEQEAESKLDRAEEVPARAGKPSRSDQPPATDSEPEPPRDVSEKAVNSANEDADGVGDEATARARRSPVAQAAGGPPEDPDTPFTPSPFVTGRTRSRLSRCSVRCSGGGGGSSRTLESLLSDASLFEATLPTPVRTSRKTPRSQSSDDVFYPSPRPRGYAQPRGDGSRDLPGSSLTSDLQSSRSSSGLSDSQADTFILPRGGAEPSQSLPDTLILERQADSQSLHCEDYLKSYAPKVVCHEIREEEEEEEFLTDDRTSSDAVNPREEPNAAAGAERMDVPGSRGNPWITEGSDTDVDPSSTTTTSSSPTGSSSASSCYFSPRRPREGSSDTPVTPGATGCTPRFSMSRLSLGLRRSQGHLAPDRHPRAYTPGGRPAAPPPEEPVEYLYTDTEQGHELIETHIPPTGAEETVLYDWRSLRADREEEVKGGRALPDTLGMTDKELRRRLVALGESPGPISTRTRPVYVKRLRRLVLESNSPATPQQQLKQPDHTHTDLGYSVELSRALRTFDLPDCHAAEMELCQQFDQPDQNKKWREGVIKSSFNYLLLDPRVTKNLPFRSRSMSPQECFHTFVHAVFYVGKGKRSRPYSHLYEALEYFKGDKTSKKLCSKVQHILQVWREDQGVVSLHCFQNVIPVEAFTREACMVDAVGLKMLTNQKRGDYYGVVSTWQARKRRELGVHLLYRAMQIFLAEGERQLRPADIRQ